MTDGFCLSNQATLVVGGVLGAMSGAIVWLAKALLASNEDRIKELARLAYRGTDTADRALEHAERTREH